MSDVHHDEFFTADDLRRLGSDYLAMKQNEAAQAAQAVAEAKRKVMEELLQPVVVTDEMRARFLQRLRSAAESGQHAFLAMRFPSEFCTDQGRMITAGGAEWPETLVGRPRQFYEIWRDELKPRGYGIRAEILDYRDGMPGDAGLYISWT